MAEGWGGWDTLATLKVAEPVVAEPPKFEVPEHIITMLIAASMPVNKDGLLALQQQHKKQLDRYKESEMELRKLCATFFVPTPTEGVNNVELGNGYTAKIGIAYNYKLDPDNEKIEACLGSFAKISNEAAFIADRIVTWTPNFVLSEYRKLQEDEKSSDAYIAKNANAMLTKLTEVLTITDKAPTLEVKEPKRKK